jgi:putative polyhydroxyalkanoate system protein
MSDIKMIKFHSLPMAKARALVQKAANDLAEEYNLTSEWHGNTLRFHRSGVEGQMQVSDAEIRLDVTLGFLLRPFKAKFVEHIEHNFDRLLAHAAKAAKAPAKKAARKPATKSRSGKA